MRLTAALLFALVVAIAPASASADPNAPDDGPPLATPRPNAAGLRPIDVAQRRIRAYLATIPGMRPDVVVVPATGAVPWPLSPIGADVHAEIWTVVPRVANAADGVGAPLMMFAVRTDTGEVFALFMRDMQKEPTFH